LRFIPWKYLIGRAARTYGVIDPVSLMARLRRFSQPSEVQEPMELLREGIKFHARGVINAKAIQHNLDWVWPFWVERQFNPDDPAFIPRAFSFSHVNLTHRSWTAVGRPDVPLYPIVDPRGLITPFHNGWSIDFWILAEDGEALLPSKLPSIEQRLDLSDGPILVTCGRRGAMDLTVKVHVSGPAAEPMLHAAAKGRSDAGGWLVCAVRPYNPEGVQLIEEIAFDPAHRRIDVDGEALVQLGDSPEKVLFSSYRDGDVRYMPHRRPGADSVKCPVGMASAAALFAMPAGAHKQIEVKIALNANGRKRFGSPPVQTESWDRALAPAAQLQVPDPKVGFLYRAALTTLVLLSADDVVPGPFTYRRFWFRDACLMIHSMLAANLTARSRRLFDAFPGRQKRSGFFHSQEGEWDANGQVLWILDRYQTLTGEKLSADLQRAVSRGARWIQDKRTPAESGELHAGLLPAGFSAEHLGPNDYYFWDDFWAVAGLRAAARIVHRAKDNEASARFRRWADDLEQRIWSIIRRLPEHRSRGAIPASPYRRMDAGAVGSLVADYPLQLTKPGDGRIRRTVDFLMRNCFYDGAFFQDMIHSGMNAYLTLAVAQSLLREGDPVYRDLMRRIAELASPTGQWPEAIHPRTGGGCMGDGQHGWAAAEWVMMIRNLFVREEKGRLLVGTGLLSEWMQSKERLGFGPTPTPAGAVSVRVDPTVRGPEVRIDIDGTGEGGGPSTEIRVPGYRPIVGAQAGKCYLLSKEEP
jgi:hypothetical protein